MKPTMGVLITYFNERELLCECLESLRLQTLPPDEIIIYDDHSEFPAHLYVPGDMPVRIMRGEEKRGPGRGRNVLLAASSAEYIHFHDCDDVFLPEWCQRVHQTIEQTGAELVLTEISSFREDKIICEKVMKLQDAKPGGDFVAFNIGRAILTSGGVYRRSRVMDIGGYREQLEYSEDFDFHVRMAAGGAAFAVISEPLIMLRLREAGRTYKDQISTYWGGIQAIQLLAGELPAKYRDVLAEHAAYLGSRLFGVGSYLKARQAFRLAKKIGRPFFAHKSKRYRLAVKVCGIECTEWAALAFRTVRFKGPRINKR